MKKSEEMVICPKTGKKITLFEHKWGLDAPTFAKLEGISASALHMRVMNYGTPFQRRAKPSKWEIKYGKTIREIALELNIHPVTVGQRERLHGDVYREPEPDTAGTWNRGLQHTDIHWKDNPKYITCGKPTFFKLEDIL